MIGIKEAAEVLGTSRMHLAHIIDVGDILPSVMPTGSVWEHVDDIKFSPADLIAFAAEIDKRRFVAVKAAHSTVIDPEATFAFSKGWTALVADLAAELVKLDGPPRITGGKEKLGSLILYCDYEAGQAEKVRALKSAIRKRSLEVCDECGAPGRLRMGASIAKTTCDRHAHLAAPFREDDGEIIDLPPNGGPIYKDGRQGKYGVDR